MIEIRDMRFSYGKGAFALDIPELRIEKGERVAFAGPSGCGKTTLIYLIAGILRPDSGTITIQGKDIGAFGDVQLRRFRITEIGFVFQEFELIEYLTAKENILLPFLVNRSVKPTKEVHDRIAELADATGISDKLSRYPRKLSHGERQRVAICRALATNPAIMVADEPTGNLDPANKTAIMKIMTEQAERRGATLLMVTHDHSLFDEFDRVVDIPGFAGKEGPA